VNLLQLRNELLEEFISYYGTAFAVRSESLAAERSARLRMDDATMLQPLVELGTRYALENEQLDDRLRNIVSGLDFGEFVRAGLIRDPEVHRLFKHQGQSLDAHLRGRNVVVGAGTGSGKTESFYLPILARIAREAVAERWASGTVEDTEWWIGKRPFTRQRVGDRRPRAVRALVLYPMNALVDDQMRRLREALDSDAARAWQRKHLNGNLIYFGRYNGPAPVAGNPDDRSKVELYRRALKSAAQRAARCPDELYSFVPRLDGAEMRGRWDMIADPPDILITNYSMLNVMLMRDLESPLFEQTARWLAADDRHVFTLVVDELHLYRGTMGTEVALMLRNALARFGLEGDVRKQLRVIATSASLGEPEQRDGFLRKFFAISEPFEDCRGDVVFRPTVSDVLKSATDLFAEFSESGDPSALAANFGSAELGDGMKTSGAVGAALEASRCAAASDEPRPVEWGLLATAAFGEHPRADEALDGLIKALRHEDPADPPFPLLPTKVHYFSRTISGGWVCVSPECPFRKGFDADRNVGRYFTQPRQHCECGSRVLHLLYCDTCGESYVGGWLVQTNDGHKIINTDPIKIEHEGVPEQRTLENYVVLWPCRGRKPEFEAISMHEAADGFNQEVYFMLDYTPASLDPSIGKIQFTTPDRATHYAYTLKLKHPRTRIESAAKQLNALKTRIPAFPVGCARCGDSNYRSAPIIDDVAVSRSHPSRFRYHVVRETGTGLHKATQVMTDALAFKLRNSGGTERLIVFSDSRNDAATLCADVERGHYQDLVRQATIQILDRNLRERRGLGAFVKDPEMVLLSADERAATDQFVQSNYELAAQIAAMRQPFTPEAKRLETQRKIDEFCGPVALQEVIDLVETTLLNLGSNPAGIDAHCQTFRAAATKYPWYEAFRPGADGARHKPAHPSRDEERILGRIRAALSEELLRLSFSGARRDFQQLGIGQLVPLQRAGSAVMRPYVEGMVHVLSMMGRIDGLREPSYRHESQDWRLWGDFRKYAERVARKLGRAAKDVSDEIFNALHAVGALSDGLLLDSRRIGINPPGETAWVCEKCRRRHLFDVGDVCTQCDGTIVQKPLAMFAVEPDYYTRVARERPLVRLHAEELSGQTSLSDALDRARLFRNKFFDTEDPQYSAIDLLSVTTTMEAGIDIGSLRSVLMANVPPQRFNYQQRAGRAGRKGTGTSVVFTVCRSRSHDEYYFANPRRITGDVPPAPRLSVDMQKIARRIVAQESLRLAFAHALSEVGLPPMSGEGEELAGSDEGTTHGNFSFVQDWVRLDPSVRAFLQDSPRIDEVVNRVVAETGIAAAAVLTYVRSELADEIQHRVYDLRVAAAPGAPLSREAAQAGILPLFGFPTRVRPLYWRAPRSSFLWPPAPDAVSRDLRIAISEFAPGNEIVRDKKLYRCWGLVSYEGSPVPNERPYRNVQSLSLCNVCTRISDETRIGTPCGQCPGGVIGSRTVLEPLGFRTDFAEEGRSYEWGNERSLRASRAKLGNAPTNTLRAIESADVGYADGDVYLVNDAKGNGFTFVRVTGHPGLLERHAVDNRMIPVDQAPIVDGLESVGLACITRTDVMLVGAGTMLRQRYRIDSSSTARRAAWHSLGSVFLTAAAVRLDVDPLEFTSGVWRLHDDGCDRIFLFLSDSLENGAGFAAQLSQDDEFRGLLADILGPNIAGRFYDVKHRDCSASCYDCLRGYHNRDLHPLLDWRLSIDLASLLSGHELPDDSELTKRCAQELSDRLGLGWDVRRVGSYWIASDTSRGVAFGHPFLSEPPEWAFVGLRSGLRTSPFEWARRPHLVELLIADGDAVTYEPWIGEQQLGMRRA
jgi:Lhr-like helicase